ncbi:transposable element Tcb1 transposase [Trichonephila clavipes]|nr:transposable element Tcb1 transposase [Trichonephila clavipes]
MFAIAAISSRQTIVNKYLQNNKGVNWNGLTVDDFVVVVFVVGFVVVVFVAVTAKRNRRSTVSDLSRQLSSATGTTVSRQTVYRRLGLIDICARRPVRGVPITATHCRLRLKWSREHALWAPM